MNAETPHVNDLIMRAYDNRMDILEQLTLTRQRGREAAIREQTQAFLRLVSIDPAIGSNPKDWEKVRNLAIFFRPWENSEYILDEDEKNSLRLGALHLQEAFYHGKFLDWSREEKAAVAYLANRFAKIIAAHRFDNMLTNDGCARFEELVQCVDKFTHQYFRKIDHRQKKNQRRTRKLDARLKGGRLKPEIEVRQNSARTADAALCKEIKQTKKAYECSKNSVLADMQRNPSLYLMYLIKTALVADDIIPTQYHYHEEKRPFALLNYIPEGENLLTHNFLFQSADKEQRMFYTFHINKYHLSWALFAASYMRNEQRKKENNP